MPLYKGAAIAYCQGLKYITKNLEEVKPTMLLGVPVLIETLYKKNFQNRRCAHQVARQIVMRQHNAFGNSSSTGSIHETDYASWRAGAHRDFI